MKTEKDEPTEEHDIIGVVSITDLLRNLTLIKKYSFEKHDERIYLCADQIENELNKLRYGNFILEKEW